MYKKDMSNDFNKVRIQQTQNERFTNKERDLTIDSTWGYLKNVTITEFNANFTKLNACLCLHIFAPFQTYIYRKFLLEDTVTYQPLPKEDSSRLPLKTHGMLKSAIDSPIGLLFAIVAIVYHKNPCTPNWTPAVISFDTLSCKVWIEWHCWVFNSQLAANVIAVIAVIAIVLLFRTLESRCIHGRGKDKSQPLQGSGGGIGCTADWLTLESTESWQILAVNFSIVQSIKRIMLWSKALNLELFKPILL